jgi:hypothetical protein
MRGTCAAAAFGVAGCGLVVGLGDFEPAARPGMYGEGDASDVEDDATFADAADAADAGAADAIDATVDTSDSSAPAADGSRDPMECPPRVDAAGALVADFETVLGSAFTNKDGDGISVDVDAGCPPGSLFAPGGQRKYVYTAPLGSPTSVEVDLDVLLREGWGTGNVAQISADFSQFTQVAIGAAQVYLREEASNQGQRVHSGVTVRPPGWFHARLVVDRVAQKATLTVDGTTIEDRLFYHVDAASAAAVWVGFENGSAESTGVHVDNVVIRVF